MRSLLVPVALPLLLALTASLAAQDHTHAAAVDAVTAPVPAQRWTTDAPLREGMGRIRNAVDALQHAEHGHMDPRQLAALGGGIERDIGFIVSRCKLGPHADAALHPILGTLAQGAQSLKSTPADLSKVPSMRGALQEYARQFDDPGAGGGNEPGQAR